MKTSSWKETFIRAGRTFVQAFVAYVAANFVFNVSYLTDQDALQKWLLGLACSAIAAGVAAVMNLPAKSETGNG